MASGAGAGGAEGTLGTGVGSCPRAGHQPARARMLQTPQGLGGCRLPPCPDKGPSPKLPGGSCSARGSPEQEHPISGWPSLCPPRLSTRPAAKPTLRRSSSERAAQLFFFLTFLFHLALPTSGAGGIPTGWGVPSSRQENSPRCSAVFQDSSGCSQHRRYHGSASQSAQAGVSEFADWKETRDTTGGMAQDPSRSSQGLQPPNPRSLRLQAPPKTQEPQASGPQIPGASNFRPPKSQEPQGLQPLKTQEPRASAPQNSGASGFSSQIPVAPRASAPQIPGASGFRPPNPRSPKAFSPPKTQHPQLSAPLIPGASGFSPPNPRSLGLQPPKSQEPHPKTQEPRASAPQTPGAWGSPAAQELLCRACTSRT